MEFAVQIEPQFGFTYEEVRDIAHEAESGGFAALWVSDHLFLNDGSAGTNCLEAWTLLAALTQATTTLRLGTLVTCQSYRNPALLAKIAAGIDHISGERLEFGVGAGWKELEYLAYGYEFPAPAVRIGQLVDTIEICLRMWREDKATYHGKHYRIDQAQCAPKPARPLRMWIAGSKPRIMRVVAKYADAVNVGGFPDVPAYAAAMAELEKACAEIGRDPRTILRSHFAQWRISDSRREIDAVIERLRQYAALGVTYFNLMFPYGHDRESVRLFAKYVLPEMRR